MLIWCFWGGLPEGWADTQNLADGVGGLRNARKGSALATKAVETQGKGSVSATKAVEAQGSVLATKAVEAQGSVSVTKAVKAQGSVSATKAVEAQGSVSATKAVEAQGKGSVSVTKAVETQGKGSALLGSGRQRTGSAPTWSLPTSVLLERWRRRSLSLSRERWRRYAYRKVGGGVIWSSGQAAIFCCTPRSLWRVV